MKQELMLLENALPLSAKEIQIPGKELNSLQKSQYLKNIENTRNEIIKKIDVCMDFQKEQYIKQETEKLLHKLKNSDIQKLIDRFNEVVSRRNEILKAKINPLNDEIKTIYGEIEKLTKKDKNFKLPFSNYDSEIEKCEEHKIESFIDNYHFESDARENFSNNKTKVFENKKKIVQTQYKLLQDAILYYKVDRFKELLIDFLKMRNEINKIYIPIIQSKPNIISVD